MAETKPDAIVKTILPDVDRTGLKLTIPEGTNLRELLEYIKKMIHDEEQVYDVTTNFDMILPEGLIAFDQAVKEVFGWSVGKTEQTIFGPKPPQKINIEVGPGRTVQATFGVIETPGLNGKLVVGHYMKDGLPRLSLRAIVLNKHRGRIDVLATMIREFAARNSIYKGQAVYLPVVNEDEAQSIEDYFPRFLNLGGITASDLIFSKETADVMEDNVFGPVRYTDEYRRQQIPLKTGILMEGPYGCGKTLSALVLAKEAVQNGWTFFLVKDARHLKHNLNFAMNYQPAIVFCEDIDRVMDNEEGRTENIDAILNTIDGVMSKSSELMVVLTTNHVEKISKPMLRPGRLDVVVSITPPDAGAVGMLLRKYGRGLIPVNEDLTEVCEHLSGQIPAMIREVVERSKRSAIATGGAMANGGIVIRNADLMRAALGLLRHLELLKETEADERSDIEKAAEIIVKSPAFDISNLRKSAEAAEDIAENLEKVEYILEDVSTAMQRLSSATATLNLDELPEADEDAIEGV